MSQMFNNNSQSNTDILPIEPSNTVYIKNLNEKIRKEVLKKTLYALCSQFGPILEIVADRTLKHRGQAFVVYKDISAATETINELRGFLLFDKPMVVNYSKNKSDIITRVEGTFNPNIINIRKNNRLMEKQKKRKADAELEGEPSAKRAISSTRNVASDSFDPLSNLPNKILYISKLEESVTQEDLKSIFSKFPGFERLTLPPGRRLAFVFFENEFQSSHAMKMCQGMKVHPSDSTGLYIVFAVT